MRKLLVVGAAVATMSVTFALHSAEKESAAFILYTGMSSDYGTATSLLSRFSTFDESDALAEFSSEKRPCFMIVVK